MDNVMRPTLPPKTGYVETIDEEGNHVYEPTPETVEMKRKEAELRDIKKTVSAFIGDQVNPTTAAVEFGHAIQLFAVSIEDEATMMAIPSVYPEYKVGTAYKTKDKFRYGVNSVGDPQLYQVLQDHTSSAEWAPDSATSLYKKIGVSEEGVPLWVQPLGATDAYSKGDVVLYKEAKYESLIDANVWAPDAYPAGWKKLDDTSVDPDPAEVPEFVQPSGAHDAYKKGDQVMYNGKKYESLIDNNTYSPDAYPAGWKLVE